MELSFSVAPPLGVESGTTVRMGHYFAMHSHFGLITLFCCKLMKLDRDKPGH